MMVRQNSAGPAAPEDVSHMTPRLVQFDRLVVIQGPLRAIPRCPAFGCKSVLGRSAAYAARRLADIPQPQVAVDEDGR